MVQVFNAKIDEDGRASVYDSNGTELYTPFLSSRLESLAKTTPSLKGNLTLVAYPDKDWAKSREEQVRGQVDSTSESH